MILDHKPNVACPVGGVERGGEAGHFSGGGRRHGFPQIIKHTHKHTHTPPIKLIRHAMRTSGTLQGLSSTLGGGTRVQCVAPSTRTGSRWPAGRHHQPASSPTHSHQASAWRWPSGVPGTHRSIGSPVRGAVAIGCHRSGIQSPFRSYRLVDLLYVIRSGHRSRTAARSMLAWGVIP